MRTGLVNVVAAAPVPTYRLLPMTTLPVTAIPPAVLIEPVIKLVDSVVAVTFTTVLALRVPVFTVVKLPLVPMIFVPPKLPTFALPVTAKLPAVVKFPPDTLPVAATVSDAVTEVKLPVLAVPAPTVPL